MRDEERVSVERWVDAVDIRFMFELLLEACNRIVAPQHLSNP